MFIAISFTVDNVIAFNVDDDDGTLQASEGPRREVEREERGLSKASPAPCVRACVRVSVCVCAGVGTWHSKDEKGCG